MSRPRLLVIDPSVETPEDQCVETVLSGWDGEHTVLRPVLRAGDGPAPGMGYDFDGVVLLGSRASVHDDLPWVRALGDWIDPILEGAVAVPLLGICFGHQLIAHRAGGEVGYVHADRSRELGFQETVFEGCRLAPGARSLHVIVSHMEEVKRVPPGYRVVARRGRIAIDGMEHESRPIFGFQFHPEAREDFLDLRGLDSSAFGPGARAGCDALLEEFRRLVAQTDKTTDREASRRRSQHPRT